MRSPAPEPDEAVRAFGRRVAEVRHEREWTQEQLAERADVSVRYIQHIEQGRQNLTIRSAVKIAGVLRVSVGELFAAPRRAKPVKGRPRSLVRAARR